MAGEDLDNHVDVKEILIEMGIYFQVQVRLTLMHPFMFYLLYHELCVTTFPPLTNRFSA